MLEKGALVDQGTHEELLERCDALPAHLRATTSDAAAVSNAMPPYAHRPEARMRSDYMGFVMDGLEAEAYDRSYCDRALLRRILRLLPARMRG